MGRRRLNVATASNLPIFCGFFRGTHLGFWSFAISLYKRDQSMIEKMLENSRYIIIVAGSYLASIIVVIYDALLLLRILINFLVLSELKLR
jgi:hypothetical protein